MKFDVESEASVVTQLEQEEQRQQAVHQELSKHMEWVRQNYQKQENAKVSESAGKRMMRDRECEKQGVHPLHFLLFVLSMDKFVCS